MSDACAERRPCEAGGTCVFNRNDCTFSCTCPHYALGEYCEGNISSHIKGQCVVKDINYKLTQLQEIVIQENHAPTLVWYKKIFNLVHATVRLALA